MEEYLYAVVPSEMPSSWPAAALQAQAIAARTYAFANLGSYNRRGFDLMGSVASSAYNGVTSENSAVRRAVDATRGQILTYNDKPISAFYSANSGGYSAVPPATWNFNPPYLQAVPDKLVDAHDGLPAPAAFGRLGRETDPFLFVQPKIQRAQRHRWQVVVPRIEIERRLQSRANLGQITAIVTVGRASCGRGRPCISARNGRPITDQWRFDPLQFRRLTEQPFCGRAENGVRRPSRVLYLYRCRFRPRGRHGPKRCCRHGRRWILIPSHP